MTCPPPTPSNNILYLDIPEFPGFPPIHTWRSVVRAQVQLKTGAKALRIGPLEIICDRVPRVNASNDFQLERSLQFH
jgi:hypothetical protein